MKLNPPGTAPKNGIIVLGKFTDATTLSSVAWNPKRTVWQFAIHEQTKRKISTHFVMGMEFEATDLTGWLAMPQIDDEGNVT